MNINIFSTGTRKKKNRRTDFRKSVIYSLIGMAMLVFAILAGAHVLKEKSSLEQVEIDLIDMDRSVVVIDFFELTYVRIYVHDSLNVNSVTADGESLSYSEEQERWELITDFYNEEDRVVVTVTAGGDTEVVQQEEFIVSRL